jgi:hypothetical protein
MKTFRVKVAFRILEIYEVEAENAEEASEIWCDGELIDRSDDALDSQILSIKEVKP